MRFSHYFLSILRRLGNFYMKGNLKVNPYICHRCSLSSHQADKVTNKEKMHDEKVEKKEKRRKLKRRHKAHLKSLLFSKLKSLKSFSLGGRENSSFFLFVSTIVKTLVVFFIHRHNSILYNSIIDNMGWLYWFKGYGLSFCIVPSHNDSISLF